MCPPLVYAVVFLSPLNDLCSWLNIGFSPKYVNSYELLARNNGTSYKNEFIIGRFRLLCEIFGQPKSRTLQRRQTRNSCAVLLGILKYSPILNFCCVLLRTVSTSSYCNWCRRSVCHCREKLIFCNKVSLLAPFRRTSPATVATDVCCGII